MCRVSEEIKFCTCQNKKLPAFQSFWVLHRYVKGRDVLAIGEVVFAFWNRDREAGNHNRRVLLQRVNEADAFDTDLQPKEGDRLQISIHCENEGSGYLDYGFVFENGNWTEKSYDVFEWKRHHEAALEGKICLK